MEKERIINKFAGALRWTNYWKTIYRRGTGGEKKRTCLKGALLPTFFVSVSHL